MISWETFRRKKKRHIEDGVSMGKWSVCFFQSNECFKKFIAVSWSCLNPFIFVPKSLMVVYSIHSISEAKIIINFQIKLSPHWVWMAFFYSMALCVLLLVTLCSSHLQPPTWVPPYSWLEIADAVARFAWGPVGIHEIHAPEGKGHGFP